MKRYKTLKTDPCHRTSPRSVILLVIAAIFLTACSSAESDIDDYLKRLSRVLSEPVPQSAPDFVLPAYPNISEIAIEIPSDSLSILDAWNLNHCALFSLIGERNSILGKVSEHEIRADYEWRLLESLPDCINDDRTEEKLKALLIEIQQAKTERFSAVMWNATFANTDFAHQFSLSEREISFEERLDIPFYGEQILRLNTWLQQKDSSPKDVLLTLSQQTNQFSLAGSVLKSQRMAIQKLNSANAMLENAAKAQTLCPSGIVLKELEYAKNVMINRFIQHVQPWLVSISDARENSFVASENLLNTFGEEDISTTLLNAYFSEASTIHHEYFRAIKTHTERWQTLFEVCGQKATPG